MATGASRSHAPRTRTRASSSQPPGTAAASVERSGTRQADRRHEAIEPTAPVRHRRPRERAEPDDGDPERQRRGDPLHERDRACGRRAPLPRVRASGRATRRPTTAARARRARPTPVRRGAPRPLRSRSVQSVHAATCARSSSSHRAGHRCGGERVEHILFARAFNLHDGRLLFCSAAFAQQRRRACDARETGAIARSRP